ncbi:MAG: bifunctional tetrahydrofolate synthase/dihydrofolate synthase [Pseudomonadota bacterium]|nr:bifunctional tetrahydrofolate synthase/dihydrofolate synthase [Pseudomonadota bacterium]
MNHPSSDASLQVWIDWLLSLHAQEIDLGLERVAKVAKQLEIDRPAPFVISVAGTNGKGSSVAMLSSILDAAGYSVGSYTSPHILRFNERIQLNGQVVEDQQIIDAFLEIELARNNTKLTYFEFSTLAALLIFKRQKMDVAVLEVGLGGRLDAVNLVDADAALITAIDVDHIDWLGGDRSVIATEKAGITRANKPAVCSDPNPPLSLFDFVVEHHVPLSSLKRDFDFQKTQQAWSVQLNQAWPELEGRSLPFPALRGDFQLQNAAGVLALLNQIQPDLPVSVQAICGGLEKVKHPGRLQQLEVNEQAWLIDVAHNPQSADALAEYLAGSTNTQKYSAVFSVLNDKDSLPMVKTLAPWVDQWFIADLTIPRSSSIGELQALLMDAGISKDKIVALETIEEATFTVAQLPEQPVLVWGSFFTVSQAFEALQSRDWV